MSLSLCLSIALLLSLKCLGDLNAQTTTPGIVDILVHYRLGNDQGDPALLDELVAKLDSVNGMATISTTPRTSIRLWLSSNSIPTG
jgi:hypothetical protein